MKTHDVGDKGDPDRLMRGNNVPLVGVVVPNYKNPEMTVQCVRSFLEEIVYPRYRLIVVDSASGDGSVDIIHRELPDVETIVLESNKGYTGACNSGAKRLLECGCEYIHLINNDTIVRCRDYLSTLVAFMEEHREYGVIGPSKVEAPNVAFQPTVSWIPTFKNRLRFHLRMHVPLVVPNGVCLLVRSKLIFEIGLFDEGYFMYGEEEDLCARAWSGKWKTGLVETESLFHFGYKGARLRGLDRVLQLQKRNRVLFLKNSGNPICALFLAFGYGMVATVDLLLSVIRRRPQLCQYTKMIKELIRVFRIKSQIVLRLQTVPESHDLTAHAGSVERRCDTKIPAGHQESGHDLAM